MQHFCKYSLLVWFEQLIPSLFPFMFLSNYLIYCDKINLFTKPFSLLLKPVFRLSQPCYYVITAGFLFGFPMGAKVTGQLLIQNKISEEEADYLLAFCNHLSPAYMIFVAFPLCKITEKFYFFYLFCFYGIPLLYGILLRYTYFRTKLNIRITKSNSTAYHSKSCLEAIDLSLTDTLISIGKLGGYMVLFGFFAGFISTLAGTNSIFFQYAYPFIEISSGLNYHILSPTVCLIYCSFGGLCCMLQTRGMLQKVADRISMNHYIIHKIIVCSLIFLFSMLFHGKIG